MYWFRKPTWRPFNCFVTYWLGDHIFRKKHYEDVRFNVISVMRVGAGQVSKKKVLRNTWMAPFVVNLLLLSINVWLLLVAAIDYEIERDRISLGDILGEGQFGDVHRGIYDDVVSVVVSTLQSLMFPSFFTAISPYVVWGGALCLVCLNFFKVTCFSLILSSVLIL